MKILIAIICIALLIVSPGCIAAKTLTQTVAATTVTQWTAATTITQPAVTSVTTQPAQTMTIISPPVTSTVTAPPITSTVIQPPVTSTVISPPITSTVTTPPVTSTVTTPPVTTTVTYTPTVTLTAKESIEVSITPLGGINPIALPTAVPVPPATTETRTYYLTLSYNNTTNKQYTNVKFKLTAYNSAFATVVSQGIAPIAPAMPLWIYLGNIGAVYTYQTLSGITINANASGELILQITVNYTGAGSIYPLVEII